MNRTTKILIGIAVLGVAFASVAYPEYQRRHTAFYACAQHSKERLSELRSSSDKFYGEHDFFFVDKGALNAEPDATRGYRAIVVYDIDYTPERLVLECYVDNGVVNHLKVLGKVTPR